MDNLTSIQRGFTVEIKHTNHIRLPLGSLICIHANSIADIRQSCQSTVTQFMDPFLLTESSI